MVARKSPFEARASLIDRLVDFHPQLYREARPLRTLTRKKLKESIRRDLVWLFNTRTSIPAHLFDNRDLTVIDYGIPDFGSYSPANSDDRDLLAKRLTRAISFFEPRLKNVRIDVEPAMPNEKMLRVIIDAVMVVESVREPVSFLTVLQAKIGTWEVHENK